MKKILLATDGSAGAEKAAAVTKSLAEAMPEAQITVLHVVRIEPATVEVYGYSFKPDVPLDVMVQNTARPVLDKAVEALGLPKDRVETRSEGGNPARMIAEVAEEGGYDLIVMGSRGMSVVRELIVGSVSHQVLHLAHCPVLIVR